MSSQAFRTRIVLLGASNLSLSLPLLVSEIRRRFAAPVQILAACGHGRSYGVWSYVFHYGLPGILPSGLWAELESSAADQTLALVTDVGNDLIYGKSPEELIVWITTALQRLQLQNARVAMTRLPLESALAVGATRYHLTKQVLFPGPTIPWPQMQDRARRVDDAVLSLAEKYGTTFRFEPDWFGPDRIHLRFSRQPAAWQRLFEAWDVAPNESTKNATLGERWKYLRLPAAHYRLWRSEYRRSQPCVTWPDGSSLSVY